MSGKDIKDRREALGYSQSEFAQISGVNYRTLQDYEQGRKPVESIKGDVLYRISNSLGCSIEDILIESTGYGSMGMRSRVKKYSELIDQVLGCHQAKLTHTPFDDVFKTLSVDCPELLIPLINLAFNEKYEMTDKVINRANEHLKTDDNGNTKKIISDSNIVILQNNNEEASYQIECQCRTDNTIIVRLMEYASSVAMEDSVVEGNKITINYPNSALIYLRHTKNTPDCMEVRLNTPGGELEWTIPVIKSQAFSADELIDKKLFILIPFYLLTYEKELEVINNSPERLLKVKDEFKYISEKMEQLVASGIVSTQQWLTIRNLSKRVIEHLAGKYNNIYREVNAIMGGNILEYEAKTIRRQGIIERRKEGREEGRIEGRIEGSTEKTERVFYNMFKQGYSVEDAIAICEITRERAEEWMKGIKNN